MKTKNQIAILLAGSALIFTACETQQEKIDQSQYWQRINASESVFLQGPKVQDMLNRDIARCVTEIRELERMGMVKDGIPAGKNGRVLDPDEKKLAGFDSKDRARYLLQEQTDYHDFETCMISKGWDRVKYVPYEVDERAKLNYFETLHKENKEKQNAANKDETASGYSEDYNVNE